MNVVEVVDLDEREIATALTARPLALVVVVLFFMAGRCFSMRKAVRPAPRWGPANKPCFPSFQIHFNDVYDPERVAELTTFVKAHRELARAQGDELLVTFAGDWIGGGAFGMGDSGLRMQSLIVEGVRPDYWAIGNHEFDGGSEESHCRMCEIMPNLEGMRRLWTTTSSHCRMCEIIVPT